MSHSILIYMLVLSIAGYSFQQIPSFYIHDIASNCKEEEASGFLRNIKWNVSSQFHDLKCIGQTSGLHTLTTSLKEQGKVVCKSLEALKVELGLQNGFDLVGLGQGGLVARYVLQECDIGQFVQKLLLFGTPNSGIEKTPVLYKFVDDEMNIDIHLRTVDKLLRSRIAKKNITWGTMIKNCSTYSKGKKHASFIAEINNEKNGINKQYRARFSGLKKLILVSFLNDQRMYTPRDSVFFMYNCNGKERVDKSTIRHKDYANKVFGLYEDKLGLQTLHEQNKIGFVKTYGKFKQVEVENSINQPWQEIKCLWEGDVIGEECNNAIVDKEHKLIVTNQQEKD